MKTLERVRVLWAAPAGENLDHDVVWLRSEGAEVHLCTWPELAACMQQIKPSVIVADWRVTQQAGAELADLQALLARHALPVVAIVPSSASSAARPDVRVRKYLAAPFHPSDIINAIAGLGTASTQVPADSEPATTFDSVLRARVEKRDLRGLLALLNATGPFRYTAVLRFDEQRLTSLWTFDRDNPEIDSFPTNMTVDQSYCSRVLEANAPFLMPDAAVDPTVQNHPARHAVLSYCGVPLQREDGTFFGTLCQFDVVPRLFPESTVKRLLGAASLLGPHLSWLSSTKPAG